MEYINKKEAKSLQKLDTIDKLRFIGEHLNLNYGYIGDYYTLYTSNNSGDISRYVGSFNAEDIGILYDYVSDVIEYSDMITDTQQERKIYFDKVTLGKLNIDNELNRHSVHPFKYKIAPMEGFKVVKA